MLIEASGYLALAAVFLVSGATKLAQPGTSAREIANYRIIPPAAARPAAVALALAEVGGAALLLFPATRLGGLVIAGGLIAVFLIAMSSALARGRRIPCGCFSGPGELDVVGLPSMLRTVLLGVLVITALPGRAASFQPPQVLVAALLLVLVFLLAETSRLLPRRAAGGHGW